MTSKVLAFCAVVFWAVASTPPAAAEEPLERGKSLFKQFCASCHGLDGRGQTELARLFAKAPPDLTHIATRRGGWFAEILVQEFVDGRFVAHGGREMPVWGETLTRDQIILLSEYLYSIQKDQAPVAP